MALKVSSLLVINYAIFFYLPVPGLSPRYVLWARAYEKIYS